MFTCDCKCICGNCTKNQCKCPCHQLDSLNHNELMDLIIREGGKMMSDVYGKSRNQLMRTIVKKTDDPQRILKAGVKLTRYKLEVASSKPCERLTEIALKGKSRKRKPSRKLNKKPCDDG